LYVLPGFQANEKIHSGYVIKAGPRYPIPIVSLQKFWMDKKDQLKYIPLQTEERDLALYLQKKWI
jgi:hypothetical protein